MIMFWTVFTFITYFSYTVAQFTVIQEAIITVSLGGNVILSCGRSGGSVAGSNYPVWVYQAPGSAPKGLTSSDGSNHNIKPPGTSERFTGSIQGGSSVLSISNVQDADDGNYYCALWTGSAWIFGPGTQFIVQTGEVKAPVVFFFGPSKEELEKETATLVCTASEYKPRTATVEFLVDGQTWKNGVSTSAITKQSDNSYMESSFLTMTSSDYCKYKEYGCKVRHQGKEFIETLKRSECF
ncbi:immunoglobulin lambda-1 light chain-like isoform X2 [Lithobates pipiens]